MRYIALALITVIFCNACTKEEGHRISTDKIQKALDVQRDSFQKDFPGQVIGMGLYVKGRSGEAYFSSGIPEGFGSNIHFRGASTTKTFTAAAILRLHQEGKLNIDDTITALMPGRSEPYLPAISDYAVPYKDQITIRQLLNHRAGVFDVTNDDIPDTVSAPYAGMRYIDYALNQKGDDHTFHFRELIRVVAQHQLSYFKPGEAFHYSNTGYNMLATIIERVSGERYHTYLQNTFLRPLAMNSTYFPHLGTDQILPQPSMDCWLKFDGQIVKMTKDNLSSAVSEGNIITTPRDLATWGYALYGTHKLLNDHLYAQMIDGIPTMEAHGSYGLGCETAPADLGYGHNGARPAYMTIMRYHPETGNVYILFVNFLDFDDFGGQAEHMYDVLRDVIAAIEDPNS